MLKLLDTNTWAYIQDEHILVQAKYWYYPNIDQSHDLYQVGIIGEFKCLPDTKLETSLLLLSHIKEELIALGAKKIIGPMDGSTWQNYRLVIDYGQNDSPFLLEPHTPEHYIKHWENAGFSIDMSYSSYIGNIDNFQDNRISKLENKFSHLQCLKLGAEHLEDIYELTIGSFTRNPYYIDIDKKTYLEKYKQSLQLLNPNLSYVIYDEGVLVGYVFGCVDYQQGKNINRSILKTLAIKEDKKYAGLGIYLVNLFLKESKNVGMQNVIYALIHDNNASMNIIKPYSTLFRKYGLYSVNLT